METPAWTRYRLAESVSAYCQDRLRESGEFHRILQRHLGYYIRPPVPAGQAAR